MITTTYDELISVLAERGLSKGGTYEHDSLVEKYKTIEEIFLKEVFNDTYCTNMDTRSLISHFKDIAQQYGLTESMAYKNVINELTQLSILIGTLKNGAKGEVLTRQALEKLKSKSCILHNICLDTPYGKEEYDALVITEKGLFIIEVKYSTTPLYIDELGNLKHRGKHYNQNYNIADSLERKEYILFNSLTENLKYVFPRHRIHSFLVVTGNTNLHNECRRVLQSTIGNICYSIENFKTSEHSLFVSEREQLANFLWSANTVPSYGLEIDIESCCADFVEFMEQIEEVTNTYDDQHITDSEPDSQEVDDTSSTAGEAEQTGSTDKSINIKSMGIGAAIGTAASLAIVYLPKIIKLTAKVIK
ncbi:MAG: NERD domain-containing protein [Ruminococcus sp.]|nr:NERD domain-containing protein [Ruminococcus sp.]